MQSLSGWPDNCPPPRAIPAEGTYYHLVSANPPDEGQRDCQTKFERTGKCDCGGCALSVFPSLEDTRVQYRLNAERFPAIAKKRWRFIAQGTLQPEHGKTLVVGGAVASHTNWWPAEQLTIQARCTLFRTVVESN
jgi:hypothetical protein